MPSYIPGPRTVDITTNSNRSSTSSSTLVQQEEQINESTTTITHQLSDDGQGGFLAGLGVVAYGAKNISVKVVRDYDAKSWKANYEDAKAFESLNETSRSGVSGSPLNSSSGGGGSQTSKGGNYGDDKIKEVFAANSLFVSYAQAGSASLGPESVSIAMPPVLIDFLPTTKEHIVPGSLQFTWMGNTYFDAEGVIYTGSTPAGTVDYRAGTALMDNYVSGPDPQSIVVQSLWTQNPPPSVASVVFQVPAAPVKPGALIFACTDIAGGQIVGTAGVDGLVTGDHIRGVMDNQTGLGEILFGDYVVDADLTPEQKSEWWYDVADVQADGKIWRPWSVDPSTLRYNAVSYTYLPLDASILGLDPVRLPSDGRVPIFRPGYFSVLGHTAQTAPVNVSAGSVIDCGRVRLSRVRVVDASGAQVTTGIEADLDAGTVLFTDVSGLAQPVRVQHSIEDMAMVADVQLNGDIRFTRQLTHDFPAGSVLSSALMMGDLRARVTNLFDQQTWGNVWSSAVQGAAAPASFNDAAYPIVVVNAGALTERWAIVFTSTTQFQVIGQNVGVVAVGNTGSDCSPINPATGHPYFTLPAAGWGLGWAAGNVLRIDTAGAFFPFWAVLTVQQGQETALNHTFSLLARGDRDRP